MYKYIKLILVLSLLFFNAETVLADEKTVTGSANLVRSTDNPVYDDRVYKLKIFFDHYGSPLSDYSEEYVYWADHYGLDYRLVPAIAGVESTFGKRIPKGSYNAYGWNNGDYNFLSWNDSIHHVTKTLKEKYYDKGENSVKKISIRYAPPSINWAGNVTYFMEKIDPVPVTYEY